MSLRSIANPQVDSRRGARRDAADSSLAAVDAAVWHRLARIQNSRFQMTGALLCAPLKRRKNILRAERDAGRRIPARERETRAEAPAGAEEATMLYWKLSV